MSTINGSFSFEIGTAKPKLNHTKGSFHEAISITLIMGQIFAIMPVIGVRGKTAYDLKFAWTAIRTIHGIIGIMLGTIYTCFSIYSLLYIEASFDYMGKCQTSI